jgi:hypothetical protein
VLPSRASAAIINFHFGIIVPPHPDPCFMNTDNYYPNSIITTSRRSYIKLSREA